MLSGVFQIMDISASALHSERARMNVIANNMANANTIHTGKRDEDGRNIPYRRKRIVFRPGNPEVTGSEQLGVRVEKIEDDMSDFREVYQPGHPDADVRGYVRYPNVQASVEMVDMMVAARAYEANITAMDSAKQILRGALSIIA